MDHQRDAEGEYQRGLDYVRSAEGEHSENLRRAIACYEVATQFYTAEAFPERWQQIQHDMAEAYSELVQERLKQDQALPQPFRSSGLRRFSWSQVLLLVVLAIVVLAIPTTVIARSYLLRGLPTCVSGTLNMDGSTVLQPMLDVAAKAYMQQCSGALITVSGGASKTGLADVESGHGMLADGHDVSIQIGDSDIFASPVQHGLVDHQVAIGVFAMIVNLDVTALHNLTTAQIQGIYTGVYQNWDQIQGSGSNQPIVPISRTVNSGTRFTFESYILRGVATVQGIGLDRATSSSDAVGEVSSTAYSIGYAPLYLANRTSSVRTLSIDGNDPETPLVQQDRYKFWNIEHMYTLGPGSLLAQSFIDYVSSDAAVSLLTQFSLLRLSAISQSVRTKHIFEGN